MRTLLLLAFLANLALGVIALMAGPPEFATRFGPGGEPNGWASGTTNALMMGGISILLFVMFYGAPFFLARAPAHWINLPNRDYWLADARRGQSLAVMAHALYAMGVATFSLMFIAGVLTLEANLSEPVRLREVWLWWALGLYMAYTAFWCVNLYRGFRVPRPRDTRDDS